MQIQDALDSVMTSHKIRNFTELLQLNIIPLPIDKQTPICNITFFLVSAKATYYCQVQINNTIKLCHTCSAQ